MYPSRMGRESMSATNPSRRSQAATQASPTRIASAADRAIQRVGSPPASGAIAAATMTDAPASGPTDSRRDVPRSAYSTIAMTAIQSEVSGGAPTMPAYARHCGTT